MDEKKPLFGSMKQLLGGERALEVALDRDLLRFDSPQELSQALAERVPLASHTAKLIASYDGPRAWLELEQTRRVYDRFTEMVHWSYETGEPAHGAWRELEGDPFAGVELWRGVLRALDERRDLDGRYLRATLANFLKHLAARRDLLEAVVRRHGPPPARVAAVGEGELAVAARNAEDITGFTVVRRDPAYQRLPAHDPVALTVAPDQTVNLYLAHRRLQLVAVADGWELRDGDKLRVALRGGRFVVGRSSDCDVVLKDAPSDVSRHHLVIECLDASRLRLTDVSAHGTYLPRAALGTAPAAGAARSH
jgi:hypothetical protein